MVEDSFVLSSAAWLAGRIITGREWLSGFEDAQRTAAEIAAETLEGVVTPMALEALTAKVIAHLSLDGFYSPAPAATSAGRRLFGQAQQTRPTILSTASCLMTSPGLRVASRVAKAALRWRHTCHCLTVRSALT